MKAAPDNFAARHAAFANALESLPDPQQRVAWIVDSGRRRAVLDATLRTDDRLLRGCAARLWFHGWMEGGRCRFACDSDSAILRATAGLLCELYDGLTPAEVAGGEPVSLEKTGVLNQFTENRRKTIRRVREAIRDFARENRGDVGHGKICHGDTEDTEKGSE